MKNRTFRIASIAALTLALLAAPAIAEKGAPGPHESRDTVSVPEPASLALLGGGLIALGALGKRRDKNEE